MGKFGKRFLMRSALNSKMGNKNFYKGRGARNEGTHTTKGAYVVRPERLLEIIAPDLKGFQVRSLGLADGALESAACPGS